MEATDEEGSGVRSEQWEALVQVSRSLPVKGTVRRPVGYDKESAGQRVNASLERKRGGAGREVGAGAL